MKHTKKILVLVLALLMLVSLCACGGGNKKAIVGMWQIVDMDTETEYGMGIEFTKDGKMRYGLTEDVLEDLGSDEDAWEEAMEGLEYLMSIEYKVKSDTEMEITMKALLGLAKEKITVPYELKGDTLTFDGAVYKRVK